MYVCFLTINRRGPACFLSLAVQKSVKNLNVSCEPRQGCRDGREILIEKMDIVLVHYACAHACTWTIKIAVFFHRSSQFFFFVLCVNRLLWEAACSFLSFQKQLNSQQCMYSMLNLSAHLQLSSLFPLSFVLLFTYGEPLE